LQTQEERRKKLERLIEKYPHIDRAMHLKDLELCKRYLKGDRLPFEAMFHIAYCKLERYLRYDSYGKKYGIHINTQDKEDLIADVAGAAIQHMAAFQGWSLFSTWMIAIARFRIIDFVKKRCKEQQNVTDNALDDSRYISPSHSQNDGRAVWEILSCLSELDAAIVRFKAVDELTYSEISKQLKLPVKEISRKYKTAIETLRNALKE
jgi:RNA polymerase sigma factor (sigma-70 family)